MYHIIRLFTFVPKTVPFLLKNRNERIHKGGLMRAGGGGGAYTWSNKSVAKIVGL